MQIRGIQFAEIFLGKHVAEIRINWKFPTESNFAYVAIQNILQVADILITSLDLWSNTLFHFLQQYQLRQKSTVRSWS